MNARTRDVHHARARSTPPRVLTRDTTRSEECVSTTSSRTHPRLGLVSRARRRFVGDAMIEDAKRDARKRFEARQRASRRWGGRGREGERRSARANGDDAREEDARRSSAPSARGDGDARVDVDAGSDAVVARGADLEELLRDAALASLPRPRNAATYFDASWSVDSLRELERELGLGSSTDASDVVVAKALTVDRDALKEHLSSLSVARLLDLGAEYEDDDDGGVANGDDRTHRATPSRTNDDARASVVRSPPPTTREEVVVPPASVADDVADDDWLDDLLNDG
jgi:hypothetical protein